MHTKVLYLRDDIGEKLLSGSMVNLPLSLLLIPHAAGYRMHKFCSSHSIRFSVAILSPILNQSQQGFFVSQACLLLPFAPADHPLNSTGNRVIDTEPSSQAPCFPSCLAFRPELSVSFCDSRHRVFWSRASCISASAINQPCDALRPNHQQTHLLKEITIRPLWPQK